MSAANARSGAHRRIFFASRAVCLAGLVALAACSKQRAARRELGAVLDGQAAGHVETAERFAAGGPSSSGDPGAEVGGAVPSTLAGYLVQALAANPELSAAEEAVREKLARIGQVMGLPDPMVMTRTFPQTPQQFADGENPFMLGVSQQIPGLGKLDVAGDMSVEEARAAWHELTGVRARIIADVKRTYYRLCVIDRSLGIVRDSQELLRGMVDATRGQVAAGRAPQQDVLRAQVESSRLETEVLELERDRETTAARLRALMNCPASTPVPASADFEPADVALELESLTTLAERINPELKTRRHLIERDRRGVTAARLAYVPDANVGMEWMWMKPRPAFSPPRDAATGMRPEVDRFSEEGGDMWAVTLGFNVPLWREKLESGVAEAAHRLAGSQRRLDAANNEVRWRVHDAYHRIRTQRQLLEILRDAIIPQAEQAYRVSQSSYAAGIGDFLALLDNWQKWRLSTLQYYRTLGDVQQSLADLEEAVGGSLAELASPP